MDLSGKVIVVSGALGTLGRVVAAAAAGAGARVVGIDRIDGTAPDGAGLWPALDLSDAQSTQSAFAAIAARHDGRIDGLVNIAGGFRWETVADGAVDTWDRLYQINLRTAVNACHAVLPHLRAGGRIVNVGAAGAVKAGMGMGAYAASKAGVARLTEALADEVKARDITVNAVLPGIIDTPANRADMPDADHSQWVTPQALADVILFLLSVRSGAVTGALIPVTGRL